MATSVGNAREIEAGQEEPDDRIQVPLSDAALTGGMSQAELGSTAAPSRKIEAFVGCTRGVRLLFFWAGASESQDVRAGSTNQVKAGLPPGAGRSVRPPASAAGARCLWFVVGESLD